MGKIIPITLDFNSNPFLYNHVFGKRGEGLLPGIAFLNMAVEAAQSCAPDKVLTSLTGVRFEGTVFVRPEEVREMQIDLDDSYLFDAGGLVTYEAVLRGMNSKNVLTDYARAGVTFSSSVTRIQGINVKLPSGEPLRTLNGGAIYNTGHYPNTRLMAVMKAMHVFPDGCAVLDFDHSIFDTEEGRSLSPIGALLLYVDLAFQGAEFLQLLTRYPDLGSSMDKLPVPSSFREASFYRTNPTVEGLRHLRVFVTSMGDVFDMTLFHGETREIFVRIENFAPTLWDIWKGTTPPTVTQFLGITTT